MVTDVKSLTKWYGGHKLFSDFNFTIQPDNKIGLIGNNGVGKTSLLNILCNIDSDYDGTMTKSSKCRIGYLTQGVSLPPDHTLYDECLSHFSELLKVKDQLKHLEHEISNDPENVTVQDKYGQLLHDFEDQGGYDIENKVEQVLTGLGFAKDQWQRTVSTLSGGEQRRGLLAKLLLSQANLLILDEPTNHLDIFSIKWLETFLRDFKGALLMVSHDRHFINQIVGKIYEMERGKLHEYAGHYDYYIEEKERRYEAQLKAYNLQKQTIEKEEEFIARNIAGQKTKQAQGRRKALNKIERVERPRKATNIRIRFAQSHSHHHHIMELKNFSMAYDETSLIDSLSIKIERGQKIGLIGRNGCGKSTLIKSMLNPNGHKGVHGNDQIKTTYFSQGSQDLNGSLTLFDTISEKDPKLTNQEIRDYLAWFQFRGDDIEKRVDQVSGGERTRIALLTKVLDSSDFLILDEPTNHLDIQTRNALAQSLKEYSGTILVVSHDRSFLDHFVDHVYLMAHGKGYLFEGNYTDNEMKLAQTLKDPVTSSKPSMVESSPPAKKKNVNTYKIQQLEKEITQLEDKQRKLNEKILKEGTYTDYKEHQKIESDLKELETHLEKRYKEWEALH